METRSSEDQKARSNNLGDPLLDLEQTEVLPSVLQMVPERVARQNRLLPLSLDGEVLRVAMAESPTPDARARIEHFLSRPISVAIAADNALAAAIERCYRAGGTKKTAGPRAKETIDFTEVAATKPVTADTAEMIDPDHPSVVRAVQSILGEAFRLGASRVLLLPVKQRLKVAYRIRDAVYTHGDYAAELCYSVLAKLMTMVNLSGHIKVVYGGRDWKVRVVFKPAEHGLSALLEIARDASVIETCRAKAVKAGYRFVTLEEQTLAPWSLLEMVPAHVARENKLLPLSMEGNELTVVMANPPTMEMLDRLRFILNRPLAVALAPEGMLLAAIERLYGSADPETADPALWESAQAPQAAPAAARLDESADDPAHRAARPLLDHLRTMYGAKMFELFALAGSGRKLCQQDAVSGDLEVVFSQSALLPRMPGPGRRYLESKIWSLREAIVSRLENFLEQDAAARGLAMSYSQYVACCQVAQGQHASINPATARDNWINFMHWLVIRSFAAIDSNGALLSFVTERLNELSAVVAALLDDPAYVVDPASSQGWLRRMESQTTTDEAIDFNSPPIIHLVELLIAEAVHMRASAVLILPLEDRLEVAYRIQKAVYTKESLPLARLYPVLARLRMLADFSGQLAVTVGAKERLLHVRFLPTQHGLAALMELAPDTASSQWCKAEAAKAGYPLVALDDAKIAPPLLRLIPKAVAWKKIVLPLWFQGGALTVVVSTPPTPRRLDELRLVFNSPVTVAMAPEDEILAAIYRHYHPPLLASTASATALAILSEPAAATAADGKP